MRARFAFEPVADAPRRFEFGLQLGPTASIPQPELLARLEALAVPRVAWAVLAAGLGVWAAARLGPRLALAPGRRALLALGSGLTAFLALDPGVLAFVAGRGFAGAPHYLEVEDLVRGLGVTSVLAGLLLLFGPGASAARTAPAASTGRPSGRRGMLSLLAACLVAGAVPCAVSGLALRAPDGERHAPLTNDGRAYRWQAELFARGDVTLDAGAAADHFQARQVLRSGTTFASKYPPGQSLLLAPGAWLSERSPGASALVGARLLPLLLQALMPAVVLALARRLGGARPLLAAWLYALSPAPLMLGALWLSHGTSLPFAGLALLFGVRALDAEGRTGRLDAAVCGLCLSLCGLARPGTGLAVALPLLVALAARPARLVRLAPAATLAALPAAVLFAWINARTTGDPLLPAYVRYAELVSPDDRWGLANLAGAPTSLALNGARLGLWLHGFGASAAAAWLGLATWRGSHRILLVGVPAALAGFYALLTFHGVPWAGPLYWVEAFPLLAVLSAHGFDALARAHGRRWIPLALGAATVGSALLVAVRLPLARAEIGVREAHVAADARERELSGDPGERVVEVPLATALDLKRRFLAPPPGLDGESAPPRTVFVVAGATGLLPAPLAARPRFLFDPARGELRPR